MSKLRKPGKREMRGLSAIRSEMDAAAHDMLTYRNADEHKRAEDIFAGLRWLDVAIGKAVDGSDLMDASDSLEARERS